LKDDLLLRRAEGNESFTVQIDQQALAIVGQAELGIFGGGVIVGMPFLEEKGLRAEPDLAISLVVVDQKFSGG
jgi:hypothetical protein